MFHYSRVAESQNVAQCVGTSHATEGTFRLRRTIRLYSQPTTQTRLKHSELKQSELPKTLVIQGSTVQRTGLAEVVVQSDAHVHGADFCENALISSISSFASAFSRVLLSSMRFRTTPRTFSWGRMSCTPSTGGWSATTFTTSSDTVLQRENRQSCSAPWTGEKPSLFGGN
jgi:hypothetical protein